jgi:hypothetical protein
VEVLVSNEEGRLSMKKWFISKLKRKRLQCILNRNEYLYVQVGRFVGFGSFYLMAFGHMFDIWNNILGTRKVVTSGVM